MINALSSNRINTGDRYRLNNKKPQQYDQQTVSFKALPPEVGTGLIAFLATFAAADGVARSVTGRIIKSVGEKVPFFLTQRIKRASNLVKRDTKTGLLNHSHMKVCLAKDFKKAKKNGGNLSVAILDMDYFKSFNEKFGHDDGDIVLIRIAQNIMDITKKHGSKGFRYGGEEFVILTKGKSPKESKKIIDEIAKSIQKDPIIQGYMPEFRKAVTADIDFFSEGIGKIEEINKNLKGRREGETPKNLPKAVQDIISVFESHMAKFNSDDHLSAIVETLKNTSEKDLPNLFSKDAKFGKKSIAETLKDIQKQYEEQKVFPEMWLRHIDTHGNFTISGGIINLAGSDKIQHDYELIPIADKALKTAKENGRNSIIQANAEIIEEGIKIAQDAKLKEIGRKIAMEKAKLGKN